MQFSKNALRLLKLFYAHPERQFYIQELGRVLKIKPGVFQRALYKLERQGVLRSAYKANARFFSANKNYAFYKEFRTIVRKLAHLAALIALLNFLPSSAGRGFCAGKDAPALALSSLEEAAKIALKNNKDIQIQELGLKVSDAGILYARSAFLPKVDYNAGYTKNGAVLNTSSSAAAKRDMRIFSGYKDDNMMGVSVNDTVYNGGANLAALREAQVGLKEQIETLRAARLNVELEAKRLYYGLFLAYETKRIAEDLVGQAESHYQEVKNKFEQGTASVRYNNGVGINLDVLDAQVSLARVKKNLAEGIYDYIMAEAALFGADIHAVAYDSAKAIPALKKFLQEAGAAKFGVNKILPSLEDVFVSAIEDYDQTELKQG